MTGGSFPTPPGWYPRSDRPGFQDYWDGTRWADAPQPLPAAPPTAPTPPTNAPAAPPLRPPAPPPPSQWATSAPPPQAFQPPPPQPTTKKRGLGIWLVVGLVGVLVVGCVAVVATLDDSDGDGDTEVATPLADVAETTPEDTSPTVDAPSTPEPDVDSSAGKGTAENPFTFGETHSRAAGFLGAAWTATVTDVWEIPKDSFWADDGDPRICLGVIVTVTLDSLDSEEIVSNPFSLPDINLIDLEGKKAEDGFLECDYSDLEAEGIVSKFDVEITEGATATYVDPVLIATAEYQYVAIEEMIYER